MKTFTGRRSKKQYCLSISNKSLMQVVEILADALIAEGKRLDITPREVWASLADMNTPALARIVMGIPMFAKRAPALFGALIEDYPEHGNEVWEWESLEELTARGARFLADTGPKDLQVVYEAFLGSAEFSELQSMLPAAIETAESAEGTTSEDTGKTHGKSSSNGTPFSPDE